MPFEPLISKRLPPKERRGLIPRPRLLDALDAGISQHKLTVIAAGAGFGKTTLAAAWFASNPGRAVWLSLDASDNDPVQFWLYLLDALSMRSGVAASALMASLQTPQPPPIETILHSLLNQLSALTEPLTLILDDYHVIESGAVHQSLMQFIDYLPPQVSLVLLTRSDPPLPLGRLRANGDLFALRTAELRFSAEESREFFEETRQLGLGELAVSALHQRIEGWAAGLQLAALALPETAAERVAFVEHFSGQQRFILEYLLEEVLNRQPDTVRRFLVETSVLERLTPDLCDAVTRRGDGRIMLDYLEDHHLFLLPLVGEDRPWWRYHHLFADLLRALLQTEQAGAAADIWRRAAHWHAAQKTYEPAVRYALAAQDYTLAADLLHQLGSRVAQRGDVQTLLGWYRQFPAGFVADDAALALQFGMAFAMHGQREEAEALLGAVREQDAVTTPEWLFLEFLLASARQDGPRLVELARLVDTLPVLSPPVLIAGGLMASIFGDLRGAVARLVEAQKSAQRAGDDWLALTALLHQCRLTVFLGDLRGAQLAGEAALDQVGQTGDEAQPLASLAHGTLGRVFIELNAPEKAEAQLQRTIEWARDSGLYAGIWSSAVMMLAEVRQAQGDSAAAMREVAAALEIAGQFDPPHERLWLRVYEARLLLTQGQVNAAASVLADVTHEPLLPSFYYPARVLAVTQARLALAKRQHDEALRMLTALTAAPPDLFSVEAFALLALARAAHGDHVSALATLEQSLKLAEPDQRTRVFLDLGGPMQQQLTRLVEKQPKHAFAQAVLAQFDLAKAAGQVSISEREGEILTLIAAGHTNDEIARQLFLSLSTVKWYINGLYARLDVKTRAQAVARAHTLGLLDT